MKLVIVLPAYNEAPVIGTVIQSIPAKITGITDISVIVVDDKSSDETARVAKEAGAKVLSHRVNLGAGGATITGLEYARRQGADIVVTMDADGQHDPQDIEKLVAKVIEGHDFVIGSRLFDRTGMPYYKVVGNNILNIVTFVFYRIWVSDSQSGYKALSKRAVKECRIRNAGYEFCCEMIGRAKERKLKICEVPVQAIYTDYSKQKGQHYLNGFDIIVKLTLSKMRGNS